MKKLGLTFALAATLTLGASQAHANSGILLGDRTAANTATQCEQKNSGILLGDRSNAGILLGDRNAVSNCETGYWDSVYEYLSGILLGD